MTRAPTYPIHRNRRNSISIRFSVRSIRFSRCGPRAVGPRPPASLALGGKEIHYPPRGAESRGSSRSTGPPQPGGWPEERGARERAEAARGATIRDEQTQRCAIQIAERIGGSAFPLARRQGRQKPHTHSAGRLDRVPYANESTQCPHNKRRRLPVRRQPPFRQGSPFKRL